MGKRGISLDIRELGRFGIMLVTLSIFLILAPVWRPGIAPRVYDDARYLQLAMLLLVSVQLVAHRALIDQATARLAEFSRTAKWLALFVLAWGIASAALSPAYKFGALEIALLVELFMLVLVTSAVVRARGRDADEALVMAIFCGAGLIGVKFWLIYVGYAIEGKVFSWVSPFLDFANVRFFGQYQAYTLFIVGLPSAMQRFGRATRTLLFIAAANFWALQWMTGTRAVWVGLIVATALIVAIKKQGRWAWLKPHVKVALAGAAIYLAFIAILTHYSEPKSAPGVESIIERSDASSRERIALAAQAFEAVKTHPLFGVGPGQFGLQAYPMWAAHPHNAMLQFISEYGVPGGAAAIALLAILVLFALRKLNTPSRNPGDDLGTALVAALLAGLVDSLFSGNLIMPHSQVCFCVIAGWLLGRNELHSPTVHVDARTFQRTRVLLVALAVAASVVMGILALEYLPLARSLPVYLTSWNPHFWNYGRFVGW